MGTYLSRPIISIPAYPPAPESMSFTYVYPSGEVRSLWTGQQQVFDWGAGLSGGWLEASVQMPILVLSDFNNWVEFIQSLHGPANIFQFTAAFVDAYATLLKGGSPLTGMYWCLKNTANKYDLTHQRVGGLQFEILQVL